MQKGLSKPKTKFKLWSFENTAIYLLFVVLVISFFGILNGSTRSDFISKVELFLWLTGLFNIYFLLRNQEKLNSYKIQLWLLISFILTFLIQVFIQNTSSVGQLWLQSFLLGNNKGVSFIDVSIVLCLINSLNVLASWQICHFLINFIQDKFKIAILHSRIIKTVITVSLSSVIFVLTKFLNQIDQIKKVIDLNYNASLNGRYEYFSIQQIIIINSLGFLTGFVLISIASLIGLKIKSLFLPASFILQIIFILSLAILL